MTRELDAIRDRVAELHGWRIVHDTNTPCTYWWNDRLRVQRVMGNHPFPATLDGAASAMPEGFWWVKHRNTNGVHCPCYKVYDSRKRNKMVGIVEDSGNEVYDRYALALAALEAGKGV